MLKEIEILKNLIYSLHDNGISIAEISNNTGISKSTVHRILQNFIQEGYATQDSASKKYRADQKAMSIAIGSYGESQFMKALDMNMDQLNQESKETIHLIARENWEGVYIRVKPALYQIGIRSYVGKRVPLHCTASGKIIMSRFENTELQEYFSKIGLKKYTDHTITDHMKFIEEMKKIRQQGYALDYMEHNPDIACIAVPILSKENSVLFCISISGPIYRFTPELAEKQADNLLTISQKMTYLYSHV